MPKSEKSWLRWIPKNMTGVYRWFNLANQKIYIGSAMDIWIRNRNPEALGNKILRRAIKKQGIESFELTIEELVLRGNRTQEKWNTLLLEREQFWMDYYHSWDREFGYNIASVAGNTLGVKHTDESRKKMSIALMGHKNHTEESRRKISNSLIGNQRTKGYRHSDEFRIKISNSLVGNQRTKGHILSEDHREKISEALKGRKLTEEHRNKISNSHRGIKLTEEARIKISISKKGLKASEKTKERMRNSQLGRKHSEETKKKMSDSRKAWLASKMENVIS